MAAVCEVWNANLEQEFMSIENWLPQFRFVSMDTEFPGTVFPLAPPEHGFSSLSPAQHYSNMKENVDALHIIQFGLTLSNGRGDLRSWEFNFCDFNADHDLNNPASITLLRNQGIDFDKNKLMGINSRDFAFFFFKYGLASAGRFWVTFHGLYDFGFLIKILTGRPLPDNLTDFLWLLHRFLGVQLYDLKSIGRVFGLHGGLEKVAGSLGLERAAGKTHQAGSDSVLTMQAFVLLLARTAPCGIDILGQFSDLLYGLTTRPRLTSRPTRPRLLGYRVMVEYVM